MQVRRFEGEDVCEHDTPMDLQRNEWPAVDAAFQFVMPSYQLLVRRFEAADTRLTSLLTLTLGLTAGLPTFARAMRPTVSFSDWTFIGAALFAVICVLIGLVGRMCGCVVLPDPMVIYRKSLQRSEHSFKMSQIYFAGENFDKNAKAINAKGTAATVMTIALCLEVALLVAWLAR